MADDDKEATERGETAERAEPLGTVTQGRNLAESVPLPSRVERALARARDAAKEDRERKAGRWLALFPIGVGVIFLALMMPRSVVPEGIPIPRVDHRVLARVAHADDLRARGAEEKRLPSTILNVGSSLRNLLSAEARGADESEMVDLRRAFDGALRDLSPRPDLDADLLTLRALQTRRFLDAVARWEATGEKTEDLSALGGSFVQRALDAGWTTGRRIMFTESQRRVAFKTVWNALVGVDKLPAFALSLDEERDLYAFYLTHPHPSDSVRRGLAEQRRQATSPAACARVNAEEGRQSEQWRIDKIRKLAQLDPSYPALYALGVAYYQAGRYDLSVDALGRFVAEHPDGPYGLRAKNHLKAALVAGGSL